MSGAIPLLPPYAFVVSRGTALPKGVFIHSFANNKPSPLKMEAEDGH